VVPASRPEFLPKLFRSPRFKILAIFSLDGLGWLILALVVLIYLQRALHRELQGVFLLFTRRADIALALFSLLLFPGVLLHEISHYVMARLLRVPISRFSLIPRRLDDGRVLMGFVETGKVDFTRDALVGAAPLLVGSIFVALIGDRHLGLLEVWPALANGDLASTFEWFASIYARTDFWLWFYLIVAVSSTMLPSESDRRAWLPLAFSIALLIGFVWLVGAGSWMIDKLSSPLYNGLRATAIVITISGIVHFVVLIPTAFLRWILSRLTGMKVR